MKSATHANRGMGLEALIEYANAQYAAKGIAHVQKISTPWTIIRNGTKITGAFPQGPSTVDYMGEIKGTAICFEAKETDNKTSFPLANFEEHQVEFFRKWEGIAFALISFKAHNKIFLIDKSQIVNIWDQSKDGGKKSIPYKFFDDWCDEVEQRNGIVLDYVSQLPAWCTEETA